LAITTTSFRCRPHRPPLRRRLSHSHVVTTSTSTLTLIQPLLRPHPTLHTSPPHQLKVLYGAKNAQHHPLRPLHQRLRSPHRPPHLHHHPPTHRHRKTGNFHPLTRRVKPAHEYAHEYAHRAPTQTQEESPPQRPRRQEEGAEKAPTRHIPFSPSSSATACSERHDCVPRRMDDARRAALRHGPRNAARAGAGAGRGVAGAWF
ncbi:uncharacterized protein BDZ99DRAFT_539959, partial [Mytilinidion resinicola]